MKRKIRYEIIFLNYVKTKSFDFKIYDYKKKKEKKA